MTTGNPGEDASDGSPTGSSLIRVNVSQHGTATVVDVVGEIDQLSAPRLEHPLTGALQQRPPVLVLDMSQVGFLASAGLALLVSAQREAGEHTSLRIVATGSATHRPIQLMELDQLLTVYPTREQALAANGDTGHG